MPPAAVPRSPAPACTDLAAPPRLHRGAWFGPQVGGTLWLVTGAVEFGAAAPRIALAWVACFALANAVGTWLWFRLRRGRFRPLQGIQLLLLLIGIIGLIAFAILDWAAPPAVRSLGDPRDGYRLLIGVPVLIVMFAFIDRGQRGNPGVGGLPHDPPTPADGVH